MRKSSALIAVASMILVAGCGSKEDKLVGNWKANLTIPATAASNPMAQAMVKQIQDMMSKMKLEIKKDHTFTVTDGKTPVDGTWSLAEDKFTMSPKGGNQNFMAAAGAGKNQEFTLSSDGKTLTAIVPQAQAQAAQGTSFTFTKEGS